MVDNNSRLDWVDTVKGIGILAVVAGHVYSGFTSRFMFMFHMPLFFFIGGFLQKSTTDYLGYLRRKSLHLLVPYVMYLILLNVGTMLPAVRAYRMSHQLDLYNSIEPAVFGGRSLMGVTAVFWFITCFFFTQQVVNLVVTRCKHSFAMALMCLSLLLSYINSLLFPNLSLPWDINVVLGAAPIFYLGHLYRLKKWNLQFTVAALGAVISVILLGLGYHVPFDMKIADYGIPIVSLLVATCWIIVLVVIAKKCTAMNVVGKCLRELGAASIVIMFTHQFIQYTVNASHRFGTHNSNARFVAAIAIPYMLYLVARKNRILAILLLGSGTKPRAKELAQSAVA
jgi:fucose 4-O-acetylase-like acetyltransferase